MQKIYMSFVIRFLRLFIEILSTETLHSTGGTKKRMGCMEAYGSEWKRRERMEAYGMVRKVYGTGIKGVCDCKQPLTILFFTISVMCCLNAFSDSSISGYYL